MSNQENIDIKLSLRTPYRLRKRSDSSSLVLLICNLGIRTRQLPPHVLKEDPYRLPTSKY